MAVKPSRGINVAATFGHLTDRTHFHHNRLAILDRLVWLVTFFGPGVAVPSQGPCCEAHPVHHALTVVINARNGQALMGFS